MCHIGVVSGKSRAELHNVTNNKEGSSQSAGELTQQLQHGPDPTDCKLARATAHARTERRSGRDLRAAMAYRNKPWQETVQDRHTAAGQELHPPTDSRPGSDVQVYRAKKPGA